MPSVQIVKQAKKNSIKLADYMIDQAKITGKYFAYGKQEKLLYVFNGAIYEPFEGLDLDKFFHDFMIEFEITDVWKSSRLNEIERAMKVNDNIPRVDMDDYENKICFRNGILDMKDMSFVQHSHEYYFTTYVDVDYVPEVGANPKIYLSALRKIFWRDKEDVSEEMINQIGQIGGSLIFPKNKLRQLFLLLGDGSNGKSVIINTFTMFFPRENVTFLTLEELSQKNAERSRLLSSRLNISTEAKGGSVDSEEIKKIIYGEGLTIRRKYQEAVEFFPRTKLLIASNSRPYFNDSSYGLARRLTVLELNSLFLQKIKYDKIDNPEKQGIFLAEDDDELMAQIKEESSQILNFYLLGLKDLIKKGWQLSETKNSEESKEDYLESNDTVGSWLKENFEPCGEKDHNLIPVAEILNDYRIWYQENVSPRPLNFAVNTMGTKIKSMFRLKPEQLVKSGKRLSAYKLKKKYVSVTGDPEQDKLIHGIADVGDRKPDELPLG